MTVVPTAKADKQNASQQAGFRPDALATGISVMLLLTVGQRLVGFVRQVLVCRYLAPEDLGRWNLSFSMILFLAPLFVLGLPGTFGRYAEHYRHRGQVQTFFRRTLLATGALTLLGSGAMLLMADTSAWMIFSDAQQVSLIQLLVPTIITVIAFNSLVEVMASLRQVRLVAYMRFGHAMLFSVLSLALVVIWGGATRSLIASYAIASLLTCLVVSIPSLRTWRTMQHAPRDGSMKLWSKLLPYAGWLWMVDLLSNLFAAADRYMMIHLTSSNADQAAAIIGQYHSSRLVPQLFVAVAVLLSSSILPYLSHDWELDNRRRVSQRLQTALKGFAIATTLGGLFVIVISPWLFGQVMGGKYSAGLAVLPMTLTYCIWYGLFCIAQNYLYCAEKGGYLSIALAAGLALNVVLNLLLVPTWGLTGGVLATVIANAISLSIVFYFSCRLGMQMDWGTVVICALPLCCFFRPFVGLAVVLVITLVLWKGNALLRHDELQAIEVGMARVAARLRRLVNGNQATTGSTG